MTNSPSTYINSPTSGSQYWSDPNLWCGCIGQNGDTLTATVHCWTGSNGTGSLIAVTTLQVWVWDYSASASAGTFSGGPFNTATANNSGALTTGHIYQVSAKFTGAQTVGSFEFIMSYTTSSAYVPTTPTFSPSVGAPGTHVTLSGNYFKGATIVKFNGANAASFSVTNDTTIDAVVPSGGGVGPWMVGNPAGNGPNSSSNFSSGVLQRRKSGAWQPFELDARRTSAWSYLLPQRRSGTGYNVGS